MKELNTKVGVFLTTYTQIEIDEKIEISLDEKDSDGCVLFMDEIRSFNTGSTHCLTEEEAIELTGWEISHVKGEDRAMYTNYKGTPLGLPLNGASLYYTDPIASLKSAFEIAAPDFDFEKDFFHVNIIK
jgi:hypothetical protein